MHKHKEYPIGHERYPIAHAIFNSNDIQISKSFRCKADANLALPFFTDNEMLLKSNYKVKSLFNVF